MQAGGVKFPWMGVLLILVGSALLLEKIHVLHFGFTRVLWAGVMVYGTAHVANAFSMNARGRIFWGTLLFFYGLYFLLRTFDFIEFRSHLFIPVTLVIVGAGFLMMYLNNFPARPARTPACRTGRALAGGQQSGWREWFSLVLALGLMGLGGAIIGGNLEYIDLADVWYVIRHYWPVVFILIGLTLVFKKRGSPRSAA